MARKGRQKRAGRQETTTACDKKPRRYKPRGLGEALALIGELHDTNFREDVAASKAVMKELAHHEFMAIGLAFPTVRRLVERTGHSERTVQRVLSDGDSKPRRKNKKERLGLGWVNLEERPGSSYVFHLNWEWIRRAVKWPPRGKSHPRHGVTPTPATVTPPSGSHPTPATVTPHPRHGDTQGLELRVKNEGRESSDDVLAQSLFKRLVSGYPTLKLETVLWAIPVVRLRAKNPPQFPAYYATALPGILDHLEEETSAWLTDRALTILREGNGYPGVVQPGAYADLKEALKEEAARNRLPYNGQMVGEAIDRAEKKHEEEKHLRASLHAGAHTR